MLFIIIPTAWLTVLTLLVCVCRAAADGDLAASAMRTSGDGELGTRLVLAHRLSVPAMRRAQPRRPHARLGELRAPHATLRSSRAAAHGMR